MSSPMDKQRTAREETAGIPAVSGTRVMLRNTPRAATRLAGTYDVYDDNGVCIAADVPLVQGRSGITLENAYAVPSSVVVDDPSYDAARPSYEPCIARFLALCDAYAARFPVTSPKLPWREHRDRIMQSHDVTRRVATSRVRKFRLQRAGLYVDNALVVRAPQVSYPRARFHKV